MTTSRSKSRTHWPLRCVVLTLWVALAACQNTPMPAQGEPSRQPVDQQPTAPLSGAPLAPIPPAPPSPPDPPEPPGRPVCCVRPPADPLADPSSPLARRDIFFADDQFQLSADALALVETHARYLVGRPDRRLRLEGHADERGTREYNLALAQKRADAVVRALMLLGVAERQVEAVSFGKERPRAQGHDETAWAQNRRVDLVYQR